MGWAAGSTMMSGIITSAKKFIPDNGKRRAFYKSIIKLFEDEDCDTLDECEGEDVEYDKALKEKGYE